MTVVNGEAKLKTGGLPAWRDIRHVDYVVDLHRVSIMERFPGGVELALIKEPRPLQRELDCDRCAGQHSPTNLSCSGNFEGVASPFSPGELYCIFTGERVGTFIPLEQLEARHKVTLSLCRIDP